MLSWANDPIVRQNSFNSDHISFETHQRLKCCSEYPANWEDMHLGNIPDMRKRFGVHVGLSNHSFGSIGAVVAVSLGARVIEKHFKLNGVKSADSELSMTKEEFANMVKDSKDAVTISKGPDYSLSPKEQS